MNHMGSVDPGAEYVESVGVTGRVTCEFVIVRHKFYFKNYT